MQTLGADYSEIQQALAYFLGWGRSSSGWSSDQVLSLTDFISTGLRRFLYQAVPPGLRNTYQWSFLSHSWNFGTQANQTEYDLPEDFGVPQGPIYWDSATQYYQPIQIVNESMVRGKLSMSPSDIGIPLLAAVWSPRTGGATEQRCKLVLWPIPDQSYPLRLQYEVLGTMLTSAFPWPPGGSPHARTLRLACLAEACKLGDDSDSYESAYQAALSASIDYDARRKGSNFGYNADRSDRRGRYSNETLTDLQVLFEGVQY